MRQPGWHLRAGSGSPFARAAVALLFPAALLFGLAGCEDGSGSGVELTSEFPVVYVERALPRDDAGALQPDDLRDPGMFRPGARLLLKERASPASPVRDIASRLFAPGERYDVRDVSVSYDGRTLLFALRGPFIEDADDEDQPTWNIWEYDIAADTLRRVIGSDIVAEEGQDIMPSYLADGRILFTSTRQRATRAGLVDEGKPQFAPLDDTLQNHAYTLHVMAADGTNIRQITFGSGSDLYPVLQSNGRILFARQARSQGRVAMHLYSVRPDGRDMAPAFGAHSHDEVDGDDVEFSYPRRMDDGRVLVIERPYVTQFFGGALSAIDVDNFSDIGRRIDATAAQGGLVALDGTRYPGEESAPPGGRYLDAVPLGDHTGRLLVSWSACRLQASPTRILPCVGNNPALEEAPPIYGVFVYTPGSSVRQPVVAPREGMMFDSLAIAVPRSVPTLIQDNEPALDAALVQQGVGILDIRSVYDIDGAFGPLGSLFTSIAELADPASATADQRPARFLRLEKVVEIPDDNVRDFDNSAFGEGGPGVGMREILGYVPVEPDGSVRVKVPANVAFTFSVVDAQGRRVGARHAPLMQMMPGETQVCAGCHDRDSTLPHGRSDGGVAALNAGAIGGAPFPDTDPALVADAGETMAQLRTRLDTDALLPSVDLWFSDVWTDPLVRTPDAASQTLYADLTTPMPVSTPCQTAWTALCRTVINYEADIQPLWELDRGANTCTNCHTATGVSLDPDNQLDLTASPSNVANQLTAYRELVGRDRPELVYDAMTMTISEQQTPGVDADGNPIMVTVLHAPPLVFGSARTSTFFARFSAMGDVHNGLLSPAELRLLAEWTDIGAQYFNDPFQAPLN